MKKLILCLALIGIAACNKFSETEIQGQLLTDKKGGWSTLKLYDDETEKSFELAPGFYTLRFGLAYPFFDPKIEILDKSNQLRGTIRVPKKAIKSDGTFELYTGDSKNSIHTNVLGGRREVILGRARYSKIRQYCTYTETYTCTEPDGNGGLRTTTCTRTVSGDQDAVREKRKVKSVYRIIFDADDMATPAVFSGESMIRMDDVEIATTSCS